MGRSLAADQVEALEKAYRDGEPSYVAAVLGCCSSECVRKYWRRFRVAGVPRGAKKRRRRSASDAAPPRYDGPAVIGRAIGSPPVARGPYWIGKRCPPSTS